MGQCRDCVVDSAHVNRVVSSLRIRVKSEIVDLEFLLETSILLHQWSEMCLASGVYSTDDI